MPTRPAPRVRLILDREHYDEVVLRTLLEARVSLWIATANLKEVMVEAPMGTTARARDRFVSITSRFVDLVQRGVEIRILHAGPPSRPLRAALRRARGLDPARFELRQCPRCHMKVVAVDGAALYLGSANFTGAGLGAKGEGRRNFEIGVLTDDDLWLDAVQQRFDRVWSGLECASCRLRVECPKPLDGAGRAPRTK